MQDDNINENTRIATAPKKLTQKINHDIFSQTDSFAISNFFRPYCIDSRIVDFIYKEKMDI